MPPRRFVVALQEITSVFHLPLVQAAAALKISPTLLKRLCRRFGIPRWPYRMLQSIGVGPDGTAAGMSDLDDFAANESEAGSRGGPACGPTAPQGLSVAAQQQQSQMRQYSMYPAVASQSLPSSLQRASFAPQPQFHAPPGFHAHPMSFQPLPPRQQFQQMAYSPQLLQQFAGYPGFSGFPTNAFSVQPASSASTANPVVPVPRQLCEGAASSVGLGSGGDVTGAVNGISSTVPSPTAALEQLRISDLLAGRRRSAFRPARGILKRFHSVLAFSTSGSSLVPQL